MEVATRAGMVVTPVATEDIMEVMPVAGLEGLQQAPSRGATLRIRILVCLQIRFRKIAPNLARSSGRRFLLKRPETGLSPGLISITPKWVSSLALWSRILSWDRFSHRACSLASCAEVVFAVVRRNPTLLAP